LRLKTFALGIFVIVLLSAHVSQVFSQTKLLSRNSSQIPDSYVRNLQNEHRKLINLNGDWNASSPEQQIVANVQVPFCYDFKGKITCSRTFNAEIENPNSYNYVLCCDGINYQCEITINGRFILKHEGGFTSFSATIQEGTIKETGNTIEVKIDNSLDYSKTLPLRNLTNMPKNYGGIYRDIYILAVPKVFVKGVNVSTEIDINFTADLKNTITVSATDISNLKGIPTEDKKFTIKTELVDTAGNVKATSNETSFTISDNSTIQVENKFSLTSPLFWSPDYPYLYTLRVTIYSGQNVIDIYKCDFGLYEFSQRSNSFIINRSEIKFKGINYVEEFPGKGISGSYDDVERDIKNFKSLGCNIIKVWGRPASPYLVNLCNRYGILVLEELSVFNVPSKILSSENFISLADNQLNEMVLGHKNNPCIFAYGLGNDFDVTNERTKTYVSKLAEDCRKLDSRLRYYSTKIYQNDICRELVDMTGLNFYDNDLKILKEILSDTKLKKEKIFISNYGRVINPNNNSGYSDPNSVEAESKYIVDLFKIEKSSFLLGSFYSAYADWNADAPNLKSFDPNNQYMRTSGLYSFYRDMRSPAVILRKHFMEEDIPNLNIGTYSREAPVLFVFIGLFFFILFIYLANSVRRFRENVTRALFRPFIFFSDVREQHLIPPIQNILLAIILSVGNGLFFANILYYWKDSQLLDIMLSLIVSPDNVKILLDSIMISPLKLVLFLSALVFVKIFLVSFVIWLFSLTIKFRIGFNNVYTVTVWALLPTIILLISGTFYIRALFENPDFVVVGLGAAAFLYILSFYRILKGTYIVFDTFFLKSYTYGIITALLVYGAVFYYLQSSRHIADYFSMVMSFLKNS
jgi:beta-galactosidase